MAIERNNAVTRKGKPVVLIGPELKVGDAAPKFTAINGALEEESVNPADGKVRIISAVPSLDTPVCDMETRRFNAEAAALGPNMEIVTISMDLPFAQKRWCGAAGVDRVKTLSDHRDASFGTAYGVLIKELRILARAVFVVDTRGLITHVEYVTETGSEPHYEPALKAVREAAGQSR